VKANGMKFKTNVDYVPRDAGPDTRPLNAYRKFRSPSLAHGIVECEKVFEELRREIEAQGGKVIKGSTSYTVKIKNHVLR
jgi:hypothetical protein